jgi:hypothetical protein
VLGVVLRLSRTTRILKAFFKRDHQILELKRIVTKMKWEWNGNRRLGEKVVFYYFS